MSNDPENDGIEYDDIEEIPDINQNGGDEYDQENKDSISQRLLKAGQIKEPQILPSIDNGNSKSDAQNQNGSEENVPIENIPIENIDNFPPETKDDKPNTNIINTDNLHSYKINSFNKQDTIPFSHISDATGSIGKNTSIHIHNPVPMSRLEKAEMQYYKIRSEIEEKFFKNQQTTDDTYLTGLEQDQKTISKKNKEMIAYLEKLSNVLSMIIENTKILAKQNANSNKKAKKSQFNYGNNQMSPEMQYQEQEQININNQKFIGVYKKEYNLLQARLKTVSENDYLSKLEDENRNLDETISALEIENKKLQNEQKLNEIVINKISKGENKGDIELKRITMDYENLKRQQVNLVSKLEKKKQIQNDNDIKITQLTEFEEKLNTIAKDMYNITEYENVKHEEKNEKKITEQKNSLLHKISILEKVVISNRKKYEMEIGKNEKIIMELEMSRENLLAQIGGDYEKEITTKPPKLNKKEKQYPELLPVSPEETNEIMKEIELRQKEKEEIISVLNQMDKHIYENENINNEEDQYIPKKIIVQNIEPAYMVENQQNEMLIEDNGKNKDENEEQNKIKKEDEDQEVVVNVKNNSNVKDSDSEEEGEKENNIENEPKKEEIPAFLEGFTDDDIVNHGNNNDITHQSNISNKAIIDRKNHFEIMQKESFENMIKDKIQPNPLKDEHNEFEELEEFQI